MCPGLADLSIPGEAPLSTEGHPTGQPALNLDGGPVRSLVPWPEFSAKQSRVVRFVGSLFLNLAKGLYTNSGHFVLRKGEAREDRSSAFQKQNKTKPLKWPVPVAVWKQNWYFSGGMVGKGPLVSWLLGGGGLRRDSLGITRGLTARKTVCLRRGLRCSFESQEV